MNLTERDLKVIWHPYTQMQTAAPPIGIVRGEGACLYDEHDRCYIDAVSSWWVNIHGHAHPYIAAKVAAQLQKLEHVIFAGFTHEPAVELAERLLALLPSNQAKVFYSDNGSTAVEVALKMCLQYWYNKGEQRTKILAFKNAYHGDTFGAMAVSGRSAFTNAFEQLLFDVEFIDLPTAENIESIKSQVSSIKTEQLFFLLPATNILLLLLSFCFFSTVFRTALLTVFNTRGIQRTTNNMVTYTWQILYTTTADQHDRVLLQVMSFTRDVSNDFDLIC